MAQFTSRSEIEKLFGVQGVEIRLDDVPDCDSVLDFYIDDATLIVKQHAGQIYAEADLATSKWVKIRATWIACYYLSQRFGNPSLFYGRFEVIMRELMDVQQGLLPIPELATSIDIVPAMSNIDHDPRARYRTLTVQKDTSTAVNGAKQFLSQGGLPEWMW